ncbi:MAG: hypothetical protein MJ105_01630 [Lachnospiraceae bacterium]|nr:hypothetical protein [Lachnospiraceae bacterium]
MKKYVRRVLALFMIVAVLALQIDVPEVQAAEHTVTSIVMVCSASGESGVFFGGTQVSDPTIDLGDVSGNESAFKFAELIFQCGAYSVSEHTWTLSSGISRTLTNSDSNRDTYNIFLDPSDMGLKAGANTLKIAVKDDTNGEELSVTVKFNLIKEEKNFVELSVPDIEYGQKPSISYTLSADTSAAVTYSFDGLTYKAISEFQNEKLSVGSYTVTLKSAESSTHTEATANTTFNVTKVTPTFTISQEKPWLYPVVEVSYSEYGTTKTLVQGADYDVEYKVKGADDSTYTSDRRETAGDYTARLIYKNSTCSSNLNIPTKDFTIEHADGGATLSIADFNFGESLSSAITISGSNYAVETAKIYYKKSTDATYSDTFIPEEAGIYNAYLTFPENDVYKAFSSEASPVTFEIKKVTPTFTISGTGYNETVVATVAYTKNGVEKTLTQGTDYTLQYKVKGADDSTYTTTRPTAAGEYTARAFMGATYATSLNNPTKDFTIERIDGTVSFSIADFDYGESLASATTITTTNYDLAGAKIYYKKAADATYSAALVPEDAGVYNAYITFPQNDNYNAYTSSASPITFEIKKVMPTLTLSGTGLNETLSSTVLHAATGLEVGGTSGKYILKFKKKGEADSAYTTVKPTEAGEYTAIAELSSPLSTNYENPTIAFVVDQIEGKVDFSIADVTYGEMVVPRIKTENYKLSTAKITYKFAGADDKTYSEEMPEVPGKYVAKLYFPENENYFSFEATCSFEIKKAKGEGEVSIADYYIGMTPSPEVSSEKNGIKKVVISYKAEGAPDTAFSTEIPGAVGNYVVRATFPENAFYLEAYAEAKFVVSYMPSPGYITTGKKGENDFYISDVVLKAPNGYQIGTDFNGVYSDELLYSDVSEQKSLYFKDVKTGAMSDGEKMPNYKVDIAAPHFNEDIEDNKVVYNETQEYTINDPNLATVLVNGKRIDISDGKASLALSARGGRMVYRIEAIDQAGNSITYTIVVAEEWTESGIIPENHDVRLDAGTNYTLEAGRWTIQGDSTVYMGGTVYVREETSTRITKN